jgi:hypothetical protein
MRQLKAMVDLGDSHVGLHDSLTAKIWLSFDGQHFPEERWSDLVVPVAGDWCHSLLKLYRGTNGEAKLKFMDGPFIAIVTVKDSCWRITFQNSYSGMTKHGGEFDPRSFFQSLIEVSAAIIEHCSFHNWKPNHFSYLKTNLAALEMGKWGQAKS